MSHRPEAPRIVVPPSSMLSCPVTTRSVSPRTLAYLRNLDIPLAIEAPPDVAGSGMFMTDSSTSDWSSPSDSNASLSLGSRSVSGDESAELTSPRVPRLPSFSRLRLTSRDAEPLRIPKAPSSSASDSSVLLLLPRPSIHGRGKPAKSDSESDPLPSDSSVVRGEQLPSSRSTSIEADSSKLSPFGREKLKRVGSLGLKRKRPPTLEIPAKDSFTSSPSATPLGLAQDPAEDLKELSAVGRGYAVLCKRGRRREVLEDRFQAILDAQPGLAYFGVFDGHGGSKAAEFASQQLHLSFFDSLRRRKPLDAEASLVEAYVQTDKLFLAQACKGGSSCVTCVRMPNGGLAVGHAGDCRAVMRLDGCTVALTEDHKASREDERQRIEHLGGHIDNFTGVWRVQGTLAVTRGIGDESMKEFVTAVPETRSVLPKRQEDFLVLATDGLWDAVSSEEAVGVVAQELDCAPVPHLADNELPKLRPIPLDECPAAPVATPRVPASRSATPSVRCCRQKLCLQSGLHSRCTFCPLPRCSLVCSCHRGCSEFDVESHRQPCLAEGGGLPPNAQVEGDRIQRACARLVELALKRGSMDDITVMVIVPSAVGLHVPKSSLSPARGGTLSG